MKTYNLHIARSPLQLINILEAIETLSLENNILLILDRKNQSNKEQLQEVLSKIDYEWEKVYHVEKTSNSNLMDYIKLVKEIKKLNYKYIFTGDIDSITNVIVANLKHEKVFLVDDGTSTLKRHEELLKDVKMTLSSKLKLFRFNLFGLKSYKKYSVNFFSFFDLKQKKDETIILNEFKNLKKKFKLTKNYDDTVYLLGQPIYNKEISEDDFLVHLNKILDFYKGKKIVYLKHRYEKPTQSIKELLKKNSIDIVQNEYPIELEFLIRGEYPTNITGFFSTAIYTLSRMFSEADSKAFYIDKDLFFKDERGDVVENYYEFFTKSGIEIIK
ncbi:MAG: hypothetical protein U9N59_11590 [Campylobacterota bacterium]|nr:hypothetical protein [Campylobacterota bacterium]